VERTPYPTRRRPAAGAVLLAVLALLLTGCVSPPSDLRVRQLKQAWFLLDSSAASPPPPASSAWQAVHLPDSWRQSRPDIGGIGWYRFEIELASATEERWALYLPAVNMTADAYVNGHAIGSAGNVRPPVAHNFGRPLYYEFPGSLLRAGANRVDVALGAIEYHFGCLAPVWIGPDSVLRPSYERQHLYRSQLPWLETALSLAMALLVAALWRSSRDKTYGIFAWLCFSWAIASLNYWVVELPVSHWAWERIVHISLHNFGIALALWSHALLALERPRSERALLLIGTIVSVTMLLLPSDKFYPTVTYLQIVTLAVAIYASVLLVLQLRRLNRGECLIYLLGSGLSLAAGAHDLGIMLGWVAQDAQYLLAHEPSMLILTFGSSLIRRFAGSLREAESLNREMARRVEEKRLEIAASYRRLRRLESARLLSAERERMIREMHDGIGSQLTSALALLEGGKADRARVSSALRNALDEMRLVIDSLDGSERRPDEVLGVLRPRLQSALSATGIQLRWQVDSSSERQFRRSFSPEESLHILRIAQEAIANSVKHARASTIEVLVAANERSGLRVMISDDGCGIEPGQPFTGRGLRHMRQRAAALGGSLELRSDQRGTRVELHVPETAVSAQQSEQATVPGEGAGVDAEPLGARQSTSIKPRDSASNTASARDRTSSLR